MVNSGSPSKGCFLCRQRKIKCDEGKPHCMRCQKSRRQCPGYRDSFDINFYGSKWTSTGGHTAYDQKLPLSEDNKSVCSDLSSSVSPRSIKEISANARNNPSARFRKQTLSDASHSTALIPDLMNTETLSPSTIPWSLTTPLEQQASCFFLSNYVLLPSSSTDRGYLDFLIPLLKTAAPKGPIALAFSAISLAAFGNRPSSKGVSPLSGQYYLRALNKITAAIQDPTQATEDSILGSVVLLSFFESLTSGNKKPTGWTSHIEGAAALIKLRGEKQFETNIGCQMFRAVRGQMIIQSIIKSESPILDYNWWMSPEVKHPVTHVASCLNFRVAVLMSDAENIFATASRTVGNMERVLNVLRNSQAIEKEYVEWERTLPSHWLHTTVAWVDQDPNADLADSVAYPGRLDAYGDLWMASVLNLARSTRIFASGLVLRCAAWLSAPLDYRTTPEYISVAKLGSDLITDIVSSIPYHLGWGGSIDLDEPGHPNFACGENLSQSPKGLAAMFCIWPLFAAASSDFALESQRTWLLGRLKYIGETVGIQQAAIHKDFQIRLPSMFILKDGSVARRPTPVLAFGQRQVQESGPSEFFGKEASPAVVISDSAQLTSRKPSLNLMAEHLGFEAKSKPKWPVADTRTHAIESM